MAEEKTVYKMISSIYLGGYWFIDVTRHAKGWNGEGWSKVELSLKKLDNPDKLECTLTDETIDFKFTSKKFNVEHVRKMEEEIMKLIGYKSFSSQRKTLSSSSTMPDEWFVNLKKLFAS